MKPPPAATIKAVGPSVLIVDDHSGFRTLARDLLVHEGVDVVGEAVDGPSAVKAAAALRPCVVLLDIHLPGVDGFGVAEDLAALPDPPQVVLISSRPIDEFRCRLAGAAAVGFIAKGELSATAIAALVD